MKKSFICTIILISLVLATLFLIACDENHEHTWIAATCTSPKKCAECGATYGKPSEHTEVIDAAVPATCTEDGWTEGKHCSVCNTVTVEPEPIKAPVHTWSKSDCDMPRTCTGCGATESEAIGHDWEKDEATGIVLCVRDGCGAVRNSEIPQDKNLILALSKIPIATPDMTEDELRDIVVQLMNVQISFAYRAHMGGYENVYGYYIKNLYGSYGGSRNLKNLIIKYEHGKYYGGIPYMGNSPGSLYCWVPFYNAQTGVMDWSPIIASRRAPWVDNNTGISYPDVGSAIFGNSCSSACFWAWSRVTNEINSFWTHGWLPSNGFVKVGDYDLAEGEIHGSSTTALCAQNGEQRMYKAYALTKRADGLVQSGHAVMIIADPVVVYNDDGTINGDESYVLIAEQKASFLTASPEKGGVDLYSPLNSRGVTYRIMGNYAGNTVNETLREMKWSFKTLFGEGFLPFTVPELAGTGKVEVSEIEFEHTEPSISLKTLETLTVSSNYVISDISFEIRDESGNTVFTACYGNITDVPYQMMTRSFSDALTKNDMYTSKTHVKDNLGKYTNGTYTIEILCRLGTGELKSAYVGTLTE